MQSSLGAKLPGITPNAKCKLRLLKLERIKDWLLMEEEFVSNQERLKPQEERNEEDRSKASSSYLTPGLLDLFLRRSVCPKNFRVRFAVRRVASIDPHDGR